MTEPEKTKKSRKHIPKKMRDPEYGRGFVLILDGDAWLWKPSGLRLLFESESSLPAMPTSARNRNNEPMRAP